MVRGSGRTVAAAVLVVVMVRRKSKSFVVPLLMVLFIVHSKLFCTDAEFAPAAGLVGMLEADELEGSQAGGLAGLYPPIDRIGRDDKSV